MSRRLIIGLTTTALLTLALFILTPRSPLEVELDKTEAEINLWLKEAEIITKETGNAQAVVILEFLKSRITPVALIPHESGNGQLYVNHTRHKSGERWLGFVLPEQKIWEKWTKVKKNAPIAVCSQMVNSIVVSPEAPRGISRRLKGLVLLHEGYHAYLQHNPDKNPLKGQAHSDQERETTTAAEEASVMEFELALVEALNPLAFKRAVNKQLSAIQSVVKTPGEDPEQMTYPKQEIQDKNLLAEIFKGPSTSALEQQTRSYLVATATLHKIFIDRGKQNPFWYEVQVQRNNIFGR